MFISKFEHWLDVVDPYAIQRIVFYKCLILATVEVYLYWWFQPLSFVSFVSPFFVVALYELPVLTTYKEKERLLVFSGMAIILISVSFYLIYPFKGVFFFFSVLALSVVYFSVLRCFYVLKNLTMLLMATGAIVLSTKPAANLEIAYGFISSTALSMISAFICLRCTPNWYFIVWRRSLQKFTECLEQDIVCVLQQNNQSPTAQEILHLGMVRNYRKLIPRKYMRQACIVSVNLRNIQHALDNIYFESKNEMFWLEIKNNLQVLATQMKRNAVCGLPEIKHHSETKLQHYVVQCLQKTFSHWNKLCLMQQY